MLNFPFPCSTVHLYLLRQIPARNVSPVTKNFPSKQLFLSIIYSKILFYNKYFMHNKINLFFLTDSIALKKFHYKTKCVKPPVGRVPWQFYEDKYSLNEIKLRLPTFFLIELWNMLNNLFLSCSLIFVLRFRHI